MLDLPAGFLEQRAQRLGGEVEVVGQGEYPPGADLGSQDVGGFQKEPGLGAGQGPDFLQKSQGFGKMFDDVGRDDEIEGLPAQIHCFKSIGQDGQAPMAAGIGRLPGVGFHPQNLGAPALQAPSHEPQAGANLQHPGTRLKDAPD
jgi:hypothetical protein